MDRLIYTAMTGAKHIMEQQATNSHNLANATTTGFRAQVDSFRAVPIISEGLPTRTFVVDATVGTDFSPATVLQTGRSLDVAVQSKGWISIQMADGTEAYTRNGNLKLSENGVLQTQAGLSVMGDNGPITVPPNVDVSIAKDGTVSGSDRATIPATVSIIGRIKLVNPPEETLVRGDDGLFRTKNGAAADADANVSVVGGALEASNVNVAEAMVNMINLSRQFEMQMSLLKNAETNASKASQLLALS